MARKKKNQSSGPNQGYLISFGDTMTALLAFFIVLNALAEDQTGADIHAGTGSFVEASDRIGVPGIFDDGMSRYRLQLGEASPLWMVADHEDREPEGNGTGPDDDGDNTWIRDREQQDYERFLTELERLQAVKPLRSVAGEVSFDKMKPFASQDQLFDRDLREILLPLAPQLRSAKYEIEIVVWSPTPSKSAWTRTARQAHQLRQEIIDSLKISPRDAQRIESVAKPWLYKDVKRPVVSITLRKLSAPPSGF